MGLFDDIVPPDIASGGGYRPLRITARPSFETGALRPPQDESVEPPPAPPQLDGMPADIGLAPNPFAPWGIGEDARGEVAPSRRTAGLFDDIVAPADAGAPPPPRRNGTPERLVPLAPQATGEATAAAESPISYFDPFTGLPSPVPAAQPMNSPSPNVFARAPAPRLDSSAHKPAEADVSLTDYPVEFGKSFLEGAKNLPASSIKGLAATLNGAPSRFRRLQADVLDRVERGEVVPEMEDPYGFQHMTPEQRAAARREVERVAAIPAQKITENPLFRAGEAIENFGKETLGPRPGFEGRTWTRDIGSGFGSMVSGLGMSMLSPTAAGLMFVTAGSGEAVDRAIKAGATPEQIERAAKFGTVAGATDVVDALLPALGSTGKALGFIRRAGYAAIAGALAEGGQEGLQQFIQNAIARGIYKPDQDLLEDVPRNIAVGMIVGGTTSGGFSAVEGGGRGRQATPAVPAGAQESSASPVAVPAVTAPDAATVPVDPTKPPDNAPAPTSQEEGPRMPADVQREQGVPYGDQVDAVLKTSGLNAERLARYREQGLVDRAADIMRREGVNEHDAFEQAVVRTVGRNALTPEQFDAAYGKGAHDEVHSAAASQGIVDGGGQRAQGLVAYDGEAGASVDSPESAEHTVDRRSTEPASEAAGAKSTGTAPASAEERAPGPHQVDENESHLTPTRALARDDHEQIVDTWREVHRPLPVNTPAPRKDVIRGYRRELSKLGLLNAKTEGEVRNRLVGRQGESLEAAKPDIIERTGAAPPGVPPPSAPRIADLIEPRPQGGVFDSRGSATAVGEVRSRGGTRRIPHRVRDKAGGAAPASSNDTHGASSGAVFVSGEPSGRRAETEPASAAAVDEGKAPEPRPEGGVFDSESARGDPLQPSSRQHTRAIPRAASEPVATFRHVWQPKRHPDYAAATGGDGGAALRLVRDLVSGENVAAARERFGTDVAYVPVSAAEARGTDAVPGALASYYADEAGGRRETDIRRINRAYQTGANPMARLAHRAIFRGPVTPGARYVLVDNVSVLGSTLADLADHIQRGGGEVAGAVVLVNAGRTSMLTPTKASIHDIKRRFGHVTQDLFGIAPEGLTASEADYLRDFQDAQSLRDRAAASQVKRAVERRARETREENDRPNLIDPLGNSVAAPLRIPSEISDATNDLTINSGLFLQRPAPATVGTSVPAVGGGSADPATGKKVVPKGIVYLRTDVTGKLAPYGGQAINNKRYIARQNEHAKAFPESKFDFDIVDRADPGVQLDIAEHNFIQGLTGGVPARRSNLVSNDKDPIGPRRRRALGLPKAR